ncbi:MAG: Methylamine utilization protein MauE [Acidimicrobiaceae bacterium]|nr:Methylamine utilization protein MauE [Acidimicrobiaceae bacterium]
MPGHHRLTNLPAGEGSAVAGRSPVALGVAALAELLLVVTGFQKLLAPRSAADALQSVGLRVPPSVVRLGAAAELVVGAGALASGRPFFTALAALCYTVFAVFIAIAMTSARRRPEQVSSCGCFGGLRNNVVETPPTRAHLVFDVAAAMVCLAATLWPSAGVVTEVHKRPLAGMTLVALAALGCWLSAVLLTVAPQTAAAAALAGASRANG